jgi:anti-anti-sigma regulatory factor
MEREQAIFAGTRSVYRLATAGFDKGGPGRDAWSDSPDHSASAGASMARRAKRVAATTETEASAAKVDLPVDLGFVAARELHGQLLGLRERSEVVLDASRVERLSTAGMLVLISFLNARQDRTPPAAVVNPTGAFVDTFSELGLFAALMRMEFRT